jgi:chromosome segregation ATPase
MANKWHSWTDHRKEKRPLQIHRDDLLEKLRLKDQELHYLRKKLNTSFGQIESQSKTKNLKLKQTLENILSTLNEEQNHLKRLRKDHERTLNLEEERCSELLDLIQKNSIPPTNLKHLYVVTTNLILESYGVYIKQGITMTSIDFISLWKNLTLY